MGEDQSAGKIIPNSHQTPNLLVDEYMRYMTGNEIKCYMIVARKTLGWLKAGDNIAFSQITNLAGITRATAQECMNELCRYGLVVKIAENDPKRNRGVEYGLQLNPVFVDFNSLVAREDAIKAKSKQQISKARNSRKCGDSTPSCSTIPPLVQQHTPPLVEQEGPPSCSTSYTKEILKDIFKNRGGGDSIAAALSEMGIIPNLNTGQFITDWKEKHADERILKAIEIAREKGARTEKYIDKILAGWEANGYPKTRSAKEPGEPLITFRLYQENIGPVPAVLADKLREANEAYPGEWITFAFQEAANNNKLVWKYIQAILSRIKKEGFDVNHPTRPSGQGGKTNIHPGAQQPNAETIAAAERINARRRAKLLPTA